MRRQRADLATFAVYLAECGVHASDLAEDPETWRGITWGILASFVLWLTHRTR